MKNAHFYNAPSRRETRNGWIYYVISYLALPFGLNWFSAQLAVPLSEAKLNFVYYCINFVAVALIFRRFLADSFRGALRKPFQTLWYAVLGYLGAEALSEVLTYLLLLLLPAYANVNDASITAMLRAEPLLAIAVVFLVPVAEECFFRALCFRNLYGSSSVAAYLVSMAAFSAVHVIGYIGTVSPLYLLVAFLQYLPAGYCLAWCYHQTGTIATPILMHTLVNAMGAFAITR
jgi:membrane protease YdiL (CAAX protease family)